MTGSQKALIYTIGYEGFSIGEFVAKLQSHNIGLLVDIRDNPYSRKKDFSAKRLSAHLAAAGIGYLHLKQLGCPAPIRSALKHNGDFKAYKSAFLSHLITQSDALDYLCNLLLVNIICLMCLEQDESRCHRLLVAEKLAVRFSGDKPPKLEIIHLK